MPMPPTMDPMGRMGMAGGMPGMGLPPGMANPNGGPEASTCPVCGQPLPMPMSSADAPNAMPPELAALQGGGQPGGGAGISALLAALGGGGMPPGM